MAEGSGRHTGSVSQKGHHPGPTGPLLLLISWENCGSLSCQGLDLSFEPDLQTARWVSTPECHRPPLLVTRELPLSQSQPQQGSESTPLSITDLLDADRSH